MRRPFFLLLLPPAFVCGALAVQYGRAGWHDAFTVGGLVVGGLLFATLLLRPLLKSWISAAISATIACVIFLYWSYPYLRIKAAFGDAVWTRLPVLLGLCVFFWAFLTWRVTKTPIAQRQRICLFLNLLFGAWAALGIVKALTNYNKAEASLPPRIASKIFTPNAPSVFVLLFDEAGSTTSLAQAGIGTGGLDTFLTNAGFFIAKNARSPYPITHLSMDAVLNSHYPITDTGRAITMRDYNDALVRIAHSRLPQAFTDAGYVFRNRSVFRVAGQSPFEGRSPIIEGTEVLWAGTLWSEVIRPLWLKKFSPRTLENEYFDGIRRNAALVAAIQQDAQEKRPVFCYAHFFLPHAPFLYDSLGRKRNFDEAVQLSTENDAAAYAANIKQAIRTMKACILEIRKRNPAAIILLAGDHGYRNERLPGNDTARFNPLCAAFYPGGDYTGWRQDINLVNAYRLVAGQALGFSLPPIPERSISLHDATGLDW